VILVVGAALAGRASAQTFPAQSAFVPFTCGGAPMTDPLNDTPNATGPLDLVGTNAFPAGFHAADAQFLYLRMRLAATPLAAGKLVADGWGFEFDTDGDRSTYEVIISASGITANDTVAVFRHPTAAVLDDPADPAMTPAAFSYPFATHGRALAADSTLSGATDAFLDIAVPWTDLANVGITPATPVYVWAGSSTVANALNLDLACFAGAGGHFSGIDVGRTTPDPNGGAGGTGGTGGGGAGGTGGTGGRTLEGGLGCSVSPASGALGSVALVVLFGGAILLRRRYFRSSR
jgi:MYXO-CTERM domain-containing protein